VGIARYACFGRFDRYNRTAAAQQWLACESCWHQGTAAQAADVHGLCSIGEKVLYWLHAAMQPCKAEQPCSYSRGLAQDSIAASTITDAAVRCFCCRIQLECAGWEQEWYQGRCSKVGTASDVLASQCTYLESALWEGVPCFRPLWSVACTGICSLSNMDRTFMVA
jgi:hypothetical protein